jgi:hypothetical protein
LAARHGPGAAERPLYPAGLRKCHAAGQIGQERAVPEQRGRATNFYVWGSEEAARGFFTQELEGRVTALYRMRPTIDYVDIAGIVDNTSVKA